MELLVNGKKEVLKTQTNAKQFIQDKNLPLEGLVFMLNDEIIKKDRLNECILQENDKVEILCFVSGG